MDGSSAGPLGFINPFITVWPCLLWSATLDLFLYYTLKSANTHPALAMPCQSIVPGEAVAASARVRFDPAVDLRVPLEVMLPNEALPAVIAAELSVTKMGLDMGFYVLLSAEFLIAL